jgi:hypothetical protein
MTVNSFAFVIDPMEMTTLGRQMVWGVLRQKDGDREISHFQNVEEMQRFIGDLPIVPSRNGERTVNIPFGEEMLIVSEIVDSAPIPDEERTDLIEDDLPERDPVREINAVFAMPPVFSRIVDTGFEGVSLLAESSGYFVKVDPHSAYKLGWVEGDRIAFGLDAGASRVAISRVSDGAVLFDDGEGGLETKEYLPFPDWIVPNRCYSWVTPHVEYHSEAIVFQASYLQSDVTRWSSWKSKFTQFTDRFLLMIALLVFAVFLWVRFGNDNYLNGLPLI